MGGPRRIRCRGSSSISIRYDGEASGGVDFTTSESLGRGERTFGEPVRVKKKKIASNARRGTCKRKRFCALIRIDIRSAFNTAKRKI